MRQFIIYITLILVIGLAWAQKNTTPRRTSLQARSANTVRISKPDSLPLISPTKPLAIPSDSTANLTDSIPTDTVCPASATPDTLPSREPLTDRKSLSRIVREKVDIENAIVFSAKDSLVMIGQKNAYLYGDGDVDYGDLDLKAAQIRIELDSSTVYAEGVPDSLGVIQGNPVFNDGGDSYESKLMKYNFKTERGYITQVITEQDEGYIIGGVAKKNPDGSFFLQDGKYTTCEDHEHPHFYFQITRGKMRPKKDVVTGPVYMVLADVPLPLALPFGYFPFSEKYSSGIIF
ncbi:MAG: hypothetical protein K2M93_01430, partial [Muribaculaceae bacterium]|nr:hypothetical protein [Muribaculaceae bacterium]